ncbi:MAG: hypothetical protein FWD66_04410 [Paludibacter sp.]|nr:hypothetical protein [Paludibacter sp.]
MKKYLLMAVLATGMLSYVSAQDSYKPAVGSFTLETYFTPFAVAGNVIDAAGLTGIYSLSDNMALRVGLGFNWDSHYWKNGETGDALQSLSGNDFALSLTPAFVYCFAGTSRLTPYVGAGLGIDYITTSGTQESGTITLKGSNIGAGDGFGFHIGAFSGFNYYFAQNLYIGAEINFSFNTVSIPNPKYVNSGQGAPPTPAEAKDKQGAYHLGFGATPSLRLGWTF